MPLGNLALWWITLKGSDSPHNDFFSCYRAGHSQALLGDKERASVSIQYYTYYYNNPLSPEHFLSLQIENKDPRGWIQGKFEGQEEKEKVFKCGVLLGKRRLR